MNARRKLNHLHLIGDILLAGIVGLLLQSWLACFLALAVLLGLDLYAGQIRPQGNSRSRRPEGSPHQHLRKRGEER